MIVGHIGGSSSGGYEIQKSLRFRASASAYLSRTYASAGSTTTWTQSVWVKRGALSSGLQDIFRTHYSATYHIGLFFNANDTLNFTQWTGSVAINMATTQVFRDSSAWYHIVLAVDSTQATASNRVKLYVNGVQVTSFNTATYPTQNSDTYMCSSTGWTHVIGKFYDFATTKYFDGYLSEINFIDGQALDPSYFGQVSAETGAWIPKKYTGTYGTNGFYLPLTDDSTLANLAADRSGNGNNWTANNISLTSGVTYDSMTDVPTLTSASAANFATLNPLELGSGIALANGNLDASTSAKASANVVVKSTQRVPALSSSGYYWEVTWAFSGTYASSLGVMDSSLSTVSADMSATSGICINHAYNDAGAPYVTQNGSIIYTATGLNPVSGNTWMFAVKNGYLYIGYNGTWLNSGNPAAGTGYIGSQFSYEAAIAAGFYQQTQSTIFNFGQRPFQYTPPTGFKALNTFNLPDPVIKNGLTVFDATTWTGFGTTTQVNVSGKFKPDLVWIKGRSGATSHRLTDSVRGATYALSSDSPSSNTITDTQGLTSFNSGGFTVGSNTTYNANGSTYIAWQWKKGATQGFDISSVFTGTGAAQTVNHSLGVAPSMIILFSTGGTNWINARVYHKNLSAGYVLQLSGTSAQFSEPTTFASIGSSSFQTTQTSGQTSVAYLFAEIPGYSKIGRYTGNGSADGPFVYCGFRPRWVLYKRTDAVSNWNIVDTARNTANSLNKLLLPNSSQAEYAGPAGEYEDFLANGFKLRTTSTDHNALNGTYIFYAIAEQPFQFANAR